MACKANNLTREELNNIMRNHGMIFPKVINQTQEETDNRIKLLNDMVEKKDEVYYVAGQKVQSRVSEYAKRKLRLKERSVDPDNEIQRQGGTFIHAIMADLVNEFYNGSGKTHNIKLKYTNKEFGLTEKSFESLVNQAKEVVSQIDSIQKSIDPKGKAKVYTECFNVSAVKNMGGTMDVFAVFSDNTAAIYDYKTRSGSGKFGYGPNDKWELVNDLLSYADTQSYDLAMKTYKDLAINTLGVKSIRQNRLIPILTEYEYKSKDKQSEGSLLNKKINRILTGENTSEYLSQLAVGGESTRYAGINKLLTAQMSQITKLQKKLKSGGLSQEDKETTINRIKSLQKAIKNTIVREDINDTISDLRSALLEASNRLKQPQMNNDNTSNPLYPTLDELIDLKGSIATYSNILKQTDAYFTDLKKNQPELYESTRKRMQEIIPYLENTELQLSMAIENAILETMPSSYKDEMGHILPMPELDWLSLHSLSFSEIDHPLFKEAWKLIQKQQYDTKKDYLDITEDIWKVTEDLFKWAKDKGMSRQNAFDMLINKETGNMYSKISHSLLTKISNAYANKDTESIKFLKSVYELKMSPEEYTKKFNELLDIQKEYVKARYNNYEDIKDQDGNIERSGESLRRKANEDLQRWIDNNDLLHSNAAWLNDRNTRKFLKLKDEVVKNNYSDEYKNILANKPLSEYYDMWSKYMQQFADYLGIHEWGKLPPNFIPNVRKEMIEYAAKDKLQIGAAMKDFIDSFNVREEDVYLGQMDEFTGEMKKEIPILFLNRFTDKDGKIDNNRKSYDLSSSLAIFAKMALNYKYMSEIEPKLQAMKMLLGTPTAEQGGTEITDEHNRKIKSKFQDYLTKDGLNTDTYNTFEAFVDYYLYGIKYKEKANIGDFDIKKFLLKVKNYNGMTKLGFAIIPASGAYVAGKLGTYFEGKKGISYEKAHMNNAVRYLVTENKKYFSLAEFFDPYNDDYMDRTFRKLSASAKRKVINERAMFYPLRKADEKIMQAILVAMSQNYGITKDGNIIRLNRKGVDNSEYKSIWESAIVNDKGEISIDGLSKDGFIAFRQAVKNTAGNIIGNMSPDDISMTDLSLTQNIIMQFKSWMPGVIRERTGKLRYDETIQSMKWGRFRALGDQFKRYDMTDAEASFMKNMLTYTTKAIIPELGKTILDISTFGLAPRLGMQRVNKERAMRKYIEWQSENPEIAEKTTFEDFLEIKEGQTKASLVELRCIFGFLSMLMFLGGKSDDDDQARYYHNWLTRNAYKILTKSYSELVFMWSPNQLAQLMKNPIPMWSLLTLAQKTLVNGVDETRDFLSGENSSQDKSPAGYYMLQWAYGGPQLARFIELYKSYEKSPYAPGFVASNQ